MYPLNPPLVGLGVDRMILDVTENEGQQTSNSVSAPPKSYTDVSSIALPKNVSPMTTKVQVFPTSTSSDRNKMQKVWLQRENVATADET